MSQSQFYVTIRVPLVSPRIQSCAPRPSTFLSSFTFFENKSQKRISSWNLSRQNNKLQTFLLSLSQERVLSTSEKNWESYYLLIEFLYLQQHYNMTGGAWKKYPLPLIPKGDKKLNKVGKRSMIKGRDLWTKEAHLKGEIWSCHQ